MENSILDKIYTRIENIIDSKYEFSISDNIGLCVLYANKYIKSGNQKYYTIIEKSLDCLINVKEYTKTDIVTGSSGVLWLLKYLKKLEALDFPDSYIKSLENIAAKKFKSSLITHNWNYYSGSIGHLLALDNLRCYEEFLDYLKINIIKDKEGNYSLLSAKYSESTNLGLHAGILGALSILSNLIRKGYFIKESIEIRKKIL